MLQGGPPFYPHSGGGIEELKKLQKECKIAYLK
jgi:hypothetical protein